MQPQLSYNGEVIRIRWIADFTIASRFWGWFDRGIPVHEKSEMSYGFQLRGQPLSADSVWTTTSLSTECLQTNLDQVNASCNVPLWRSESGQPTVASQPVHPIGLPRSVENQIAVLQKVYWQYGGALTTEATNHWQGHLEHNIKEMESVAVASYAFCRVPKLAGAVAVVAALDGLSGAAQSATSICNRTASANTEAERNAAACAIVQDAASQSVDLVPTLIAAGCGFGSGRLASQAASDFAVSRSHTSPLRWRDLEALATLPHNFRAYFSSVRSDFLSTWHGVGSEQLPLGLKHADGTHDLMGITQWLADKHVWQGCEVMRYVRKSDLRASVVNSGAPEMVYKVKYAGEDVYDFHIHPPSPSSVPSRADKLSADGLGIIQSGDQTTLYLGKEDMLKELPTVGKTALPDVHIIFDRKRRMAMEIHPELDDGVRALDYDELEKRLTRFDGNWSTLHSIPTAPEVDKELDDFVWDNNW